MENKLTQLFQIKQKEILSVYFTAGYPTLESTSEIISSLESLGVDLIEVGIPFSDPLADGPVIQQSSVHALENGMNLKMLFVDLEAINRTTKLPIILMGYLNPILQFGEDNFLEACKNAGVSGLIIPDMPLEHFRAKWKNLCEDLNISMIFLITPQTTEDRIRKIDELSTGFIYMVSSNSLTGQNKNITDQVEYFTRVRKMNIKNPLMIGFGIHDKETLSVAYENANGAIIGSAFIKALKEKKSLIENTNAFINSLR